MIADSNSRINVSTAGMNSCASSPARLISFLVLGLLNVSFE